MIKFVFLFILFALTLIQVTKSFPTASVEIRSDETSDGLIDSLNNDYNANNKPALDKVETDKIGIEIFKLKFKKRF